MPAARLLLLGLLLVPAPGHAADGTCKTLQAVVKAAPDQFRGVRGTARDPGSSMTIWKTPTPIPGSAQCLIYEHHAEGGAFQYYCNSDLPAGDNISASSSRAKALMACLPAAKWNVMVLPSGSGRIVGKLPSAQIKINQTDNHLAVFVEKADER